MNFHAFTVQKIRELKRDTIVLKLQGDREFRAGNYKQAYRYQRKAEKAHRKLLYIIFHSGYEVLHSKGVILKKETDQNVAK